MSIEPLALPLSVIRPSTAGSNGTEPSTRSTGDRFAAVLADAGADAGADHRAAGGQGKRDDCDQKKPFHGLDPYPHE